MTSSRRRVVVIGAGGHARVCIEALLDDPATDVLGCVSGDGSGIADLGVPLLGRDADLATLVLDVEASHVFVAIGDNATRSAMIDRCSSLRLPLATAISRYAMVSHTAVIDEGAVLLAAAVVNAAAHIGRGAIVNTNASVDHDCVVGSCAHIAPGVTLAGDVMVGERSFVGVGASVLPGLKIGDAAIVGGGALVTRDVEPGVTVTGVPAAVR